MQRIGMNMSSLAIAVTLLVHVLAAHVEADIIDGGIYTIQVANNGIGMEQCNDFYLAYLKERASRRPFLMSSFATKPPKWKMISLGRDMYKIETADRPSNISSKLSYSPVCRSTSVRVDDRLRLSWRLIAVDKDKNLYRVVTGNKDCPVPVYGRLAPLAVAENNLECDKQRDLSLMPISKKTYGMIWKFVLVSDPTEISIPTLSPPPTVQVEVPTVKVDIAFQGITVEQFGEEEQENICNILIAASGYPPEKVSCTVQVTPLSSAGRRLHQDGLLAQVSMTLLSDTFEESQQAVQSADNAIQAAQIDGIFDDVTDEDTGVTIANVEVENTIQEVPAPTPTPTPDPGSTEQPTQTPEPTETPEPTVLPTTAPPTTPPPTTVPPTTAPPFFGDEGGTLTAPGAPINVQANYGSIQCGSEDDIYIRVTWEPPNDGVHVESYTASCSPTSGASVEAAGIPNNFYTTDIGPVEPNKVYTCSVYSTNAAGRSSLATSGSIETRDLVLQDVVITGLGKYSGFYAGDTRACKNDINASTSSLTKELCGDQYNIGYLPTLSGSKKSLNNNIPNSGLIGFPEDDDIIDNYMIKFDANDLIPGADDGSVIFWGGFSNGFKTDMRYASFDINGQLVPMLAASHLLSDEFTVSVHMNVKPSPTSRTPSLGIYIKGTDGLFYTFSGIDWGCDDLPCINNWSTRTIDATNTYNLFTSAGRRCPDGGPHGKDDSDLTCAERFPGYIDGYGAPMDIWSTGFYGEQIFGEGAFIFSQGLNLGSWQRQCYVGFDWIQSSLYLDGLKVHFNAPDTGSNPPEAPGFPETAAIDENPSQFEVLWDLPDDGDDTILGYMVHCISPDGGGTRVAMVPSRTVTRRIIGNCGPDTMNGPLVSGATYVCTVTAAGEASSSGQSQPTSPFTISL